MKVLSLLAFLSLGTLSLVADVWWLDPTNGVDVATGGSESAPFRTLQYAHDQAQAGDTLRLKPGVYAEGFKTDAGGHANRLVLSKKLYIRAVGTRDNTFIDGELDPSTESWGANAKRCVYATAASTYSEFHGISFRKGGGGTGGDAEGSTGWGGCVQVYGNKTLNQSSNVHKVYFVDCAFIDGAGKWGGGLNGGTAIRCYFRNCDGSSFGTSSSGANLWNCVIFAGRSEASASDPRPVIGNYSIFVNCTIYGCQQTGCNRYCLGYNSHFANLGNAEMQTHSYYPSYYTNCVSGASTGQYQLFAPALEDFRPIAGAPLLNAGKTCYLTDVIELPADTEMKDFYGNPIDLASETCNAGAVQGAGVVPGSGRISFPAKSVVDGHLNVLSGYAYSERFPAFVAYEPGIANFFRARLSGFVGLNAFRYATYDNKVWLCYPPFPADKTDVTNDTTEHELWADPNANASTADGSETHPYRTLQAAMDYITAAHITGRVIVHALPGVYEEGLGTAMFKTEATTNRVVIPDAQVLLKSTGGAAVTTIKGASAPRANQPYPDAYVGCGEGAIACFSADGETTRCVQGFTLADGHSRCVRYDQDVTTDRAGAFYANGVNIHVLDCVITNCAAVRSTVYGGWLQRCALFDCHGYGGVTRYAEMSSCFVDPSNTTGKGGPGASGNCVIGTNTRICQSTTPSASYANINTELKICYGNIAPRGNMRNLTDGYEYWGTFVTPGSISFNTTLAQGEICYADAAHGDYHLFGNSPATRGGVLPEKGTDAWGKWATNYASRVTCDIEGCRPQLTPDGVPLPGCYQTLVRGVWVTADNGGLAVEGGKLGGNVLDQGDTLVVSEQPGSRPYSAVEINGVLHEMSESPFTFTAADVATVGGIYMTPVYSTHWYVNVATGNDAANTGFSPTSAKKTLQGVLGLAGLARGDTVHVAPGIYAEGKAPWEKNGTTFCRAVVPREVTLVADEGPEKTFIVGAPDTTDSAIRDGLGPNAVRGVYLDNQAVLRGFTVTGGYTDVFDSRYTSDWVVPVTGGGVCGNTAGRDNAYVYDCIISNNCAFTGGGTRWVNAICCRIVENRAPDSGGNARESNLWGCFVDRGRQGTKAESAGVFSFTKNHYTTFGANNWTFDGMTANKCISSASSGIATISDCVFLGAVGSSVNVANMITNSVFAQGTGYFSTALLDDTCVVATDGLPGQFDAEGRPLPGCPAVDRGDRANLPELLRGIGLDASGFQRIMNGAIDVGALEGDWRARYAADCATTRRFGVTAASPEVKEEAGVVTLHPGDTLAAQFENPQQRATPCAVTVRLTGEGTLLVKLNGAVLQEVTAAGETTLKFANTLALNALDFAYEGEGTAALVSADRLAGMRFIFR